MMNVSYFLTAQKGTVCFLFLGEVLPLEIKGGEVCSSSSSEDESPSYATNGINAGGTSSSSLAFFDEDVVSVVGGNPCFLEVPKYVPKREGQREKWGQIQRMGEIHE